MENKLSESLVNYLEIIYEEELKSSLGVQPNIIAQRLKVTRAAVTKATEKLASSGYLKKIYYGDVNLTDEGKVIAKKVYEKLNSICKYLINLGVEKLDAEIQGRKLVGVLKDEIYLKIKDSLKD